MFADKGHKIQLLPNNKQRATFRQWSGTARWAYNYGLEKKIEAYEETGKSPGAYSLMKDVVKLKQTEEYAWLRDVSKSVPRMALMQLEVAYTNFFRRVKNGDAKPGFPKWKSKKWSKVVFHLEPDTVKIEGERIRLPKIGWIRMTKSPRFEGKLIGTVAISERAGKWYVSLSVETEHIPADNQGGDVGIDWGVKTLATLSDGTTYENPKALKHYEKLLARAQRQLVRKQKGSKRREKANLRVRRIYKRIADIRVNAHHQATSDVVNQYNFVAVEDLNIKGMVKNHCLAGAVSDASFGELKRQLQYKLAWNGGELVSVDRFFPSSKLCNACGCINDSLTLADRTWTCTDCGTHHDRDHNAAKNLRNWGLKHRTVQTVLDVEGKDSSPPAKHQEGCVSISPSPVD